jgi:ankyrin repeat protein
VNESGHTALMLGAVYGEENLVKMLVKSGADVNVKNEDGVTALAYAVMAGNKNIAKILEKKAKHTYMEYFATNMVLKT